MRSKALHQAGWSRQRTFIVSLLLASALRIVAQTAPSPAEPLPAALPAPVALPATTAVAATPPSAVIPSSIQPLVDFRPSDIKFSLGDLMDLLRDRRHEGWVLAAYPDPKTGRPLIGAGFSLDLPERQHAQTDPLNSNAFVEPSSAQLWQAAGLDPALLQRVLDEFDQHLAAWQTARHYRRQIWTLPPQITDDQAEALLRVAAIQAIVNARAWCRDFDQLSGTQQMAVSQLVYQMGVNLGEFSTFLALLNNEPVPPSALAEPGAAQPAETATADLGHWHDVQQSLMQSQWARLYRARAIAVIAMLDPQYRDDPTSSEARIAAVLRPVAHHHRRSRPALRTASYHGRPAGHTLARRSSASHSRRKT
jgi:hypothetical protein